MIEIPLTLADMGFRGKANYLLFHLLGQLLASSWQTHHLMSLQESLCRAVAELYSEKNSLHSASLIDSEQPHKSPLSHFLPAHKRTQFPLQSSLFHHPLDHWTSLFHTPDGNWHSPPTQKSTFLLAHWLPLRVATSTIWDSSTLIHNHRLLCWHNHISRISPAIATYFCLLESYIGAEGASR